MKILELILLSGLSVCVVGCQSGKPAQSREQGAAAPKTQLGDAVMRAGEISKTADAHNQAIREQAGE